MLKFFICLNYGKLNYNVCVFMNKKVFNYDEIMFGIGWLFVFCMRIGSVFLECR